MELAAAGAAGPCYGPAAVGNRDCGDPFSIEVPVPDMGKENEYWHTPEECDTEDELLEAGGPAICDFSKGGSDAEVVWLVGDSHAQQWQEAVMQTAQERGWILKYSYRGGCPLVDVPLVSFNGSMLDSGSIEGCGRWSQVVRDAVEADLPDRVFTSTFAVREVIDDGSGAPQTEQYSSAFARIWQRWTDTGIVVYPIVDAPLNGVGRSVDCLSMNGATPRACEVPRTQAVEFEPVGDVVRRLGNERIVPIDLTDYFCDDVSCFSAVGGVAVYYDANHLNRLYVRELTSHIQDMVD
ncbi:hypothetical protein AO716_01405 [Arthrobacter sp. Edens01]|nr:hypothetical protein AO716_01405 [Arthrobacter sp. Edens01]